MGVVRVEPCVHCIAEHTTAFTFRMNGSILCGAISTKSKTKCKGETDEIRNLSQLNLDKEKCLRSEWFRSEFVATSNFTCDFYSVVLVSVILPALFRLPFNFRLALLRCTELFKWKHKILPVCSCSLTHPAEEASSILKYLDFRFRADVCVCSNATMHHSFLLVSRLFECFVFRLKFSFLVSIRKMHLQLQVLQTLCVCCAIGTWTEWISRAANIACGCSCVRSTDTMHCKPITMQIK